METSEQIKEEVWSLYNRNSRDWYVYVRRDGKGFFDTMFINGSDAWILKEQLVNPYKAIGFGVKEIIDRPPPKMGLLSFGLRPLDLSLISAIQGRRIEHDDLTPLLLRALSASPLPIDQITTPGAIQGPVVQADRLPTLNNQRQRELDDRLSSELRRLMQRSYPHLLSTYS